MNILVDMTQDTLEYESVVKNQLCRNWLDVYLMLSQLKDMQCNTNERLTAVALDAWWTPTCYCFQSFIQSQDSSRKDFVNVVFSIVKCNQARQVVSKMAKMRNNRRQKTSSMIIDAEITSDCALYKGCP